MELGVEKSIKIKDEQGLSLVLQWIVSGQDTIVPRLYLACGHSMVMHAKIQLLRLVSCSSFLAGSLFDGRLYSRKDNLRPHFKLARRASHP